MGLFRILLGFGHSRLPGLTKNFILLHFLACIKNDLVNFSLGHFSLYYYPLNTAPAFSFKASSTCAWTFVTSSSVNVRSGSMYFSE